MIILRRKMHLLLGLLVCLLFILYQSAAIIPEGHIGLLLSEGKLTDTTQESDSVLKPGLHFIIPFFMRPILLDSRLQTLIFNVTGNSNSQEQLITSDYFADWLISDPLRYYQQTKNNFQHTKLLINQQLETLFNAKNANTPFSQFILHGSAAQLNSFLAAANMQLKTSGIKLTHIGLKQLRLSADANARLLNRMGAEQENSALVQHTLGKANAELIRANADNSVNLILAKAKEEAAQIRAQGDAEAAKIYNQAYNKNPEFAAFYLNLQTYQQGFNQPSMNNLLLLNTKNEPFKLEEKSHTYKSKLGLTN